MHRSMARNTSLANIWITPNSPSSVNKTHFSNGLFEDEVFHHIVTCKWKHYPTIQYNPHLLRHGTHLLLNKLLKLSWIFLAAPSSAKAALICSYIGTTEQLECCLIGYSKFHGHRWSIQNSCLLKFPMCYHLIINWMLNIWTLNILPVLMILNVLHLFNFDLNKKIPEQRIHMVYVGIRFR